ncbi:hypothetical protein MQE23_08495 [Streptomyces sp. HP-A2021]|uniref:hypothetical protein n=1 Tax=Streptomyces sp. HP-A2021 TaxID=2927875 RepID=UPI001FAEF7F5|nr:hypothetical protein [Streptomyces sp. HP-A2021]UOB09090.1 hypothetical protein MQE23_08495 [Streptomyces sp. HP-A2021]
MRAAADRVRAVLALLGPLGAGSRALLLRLVGRFGWKTVLGVGAIAVFALFRYRTAIAWVLAAWCAAAWMHAPNETAVEEAGEETPPASPEDPFPGMVWDLIGDAPGVHLKRVVEWLHETGLDTACTTADVRAGLTRRQIPIRASVRDAAGRVNQGVHRDDLEAWLKARSPAPPEPLSKTRSNPATTALTSDVAAAPTDVATPATPTE